MQQDLELPGTFDKKSLSKAIGRVQIKNATIAVLKEVLRFVMVKIGLREQNWPADHEKIILIDHIVSNYGGHTLEEIKLAFDMAISGRLDCEANCYENFSCLYFSTIMNAYRQWAREAKGHIQPKMKQLKKAEHKPMPDEEMMEWIESKKKTDTPISYIPLEFFDFLEKKGIFVVTEKQWEWCLRRAVSMRRTIISGDIKAGTTAEGYLDNFKEMETSGLFTGNEPHLLKNLAKKIAVSEYLKK